MLPSTSNSQIFIPLHDASIDHWFLLVMNIEEATAEVWDSYPESDTSSARMEQTTSVVCVYGYTGLHSVLVTCLHQLEADCPQLLWFYCKSDAFAPASVQK